MVEKQVIIDVKEYEELKEWAEVGHSATEAVKKVLESGNPNEECKTIILKDCWNEQGYTSLCVCTNNEILKRIEDSHAKKIKELTERGDTWKDCFIKIQGENDKLKKEMKQKTKELQKKIEEYNSLPLWKRIFKTIKL